MEKRRKMNRIIIGIVCLLVLAFAVFVYWIPSFVMTGKRWTLEDGLQWQSERYDTSFYGELKEAEYTVAGYDGYALHVELLKSPVYSTKYVILSHGYTDNRTGSLKYARMYLALGFNCIIYDLRGHGENKKTFTTYGILEGQDLKNLIEDTRNRYPDLSVLGLHGESLGAATTITCLKYRPEVDFAVADCGFSDIVTVLKTGSKKSHMPEFLVDIADFGSRIRYHYALKDMRPIDSLDENTVPILFIHGAADEFILPSNSERMAERTKGLSEVHLIPGAGHAESALKAPDDYQEFLKQFLERINLMTA